jgi:TolB-like protein
MSLERRLAAILAADVVGYSRLTREDEEATLLAFSKLRKDFIDPLVADYHGRIVKVMGDGYLVEFKSAVDAVQCAVAWQQGVSEAQDTKALTFRIGVNVGDIVVDGDDILGDGVNLAARLEGLADPGGIVISDMVQENVCHKLQFRFVDQGKQSLKNIDQPLRIWKWADNDVNSTVDGLVTTIGEKPTIAVLAFKNLSGDPEQEYFSDGVSEDIITELGRFSELFVIARNSSFAYKNAQTLAGDIGRDLGAQYLVQGSVRKAGERVRISVQLVDTETGNQIWAERYDRQLEDIFELQDEITRSVVTVLPVRLQNAIVERAKRKPIKSLSAYDFVLRARYLENHTSDRVPEILELLTTAIELDPTCARAFSILAFVEAYSVFTFSPIGDDPTASAEAHIRTALSLDPDDHLIQSDASHVYLVAGKHDLAAKHIKRAYMLNPNEISVQINRGITANYCGNSQLGLELLKTALAHDPLARDHWFESLAEASYMLGKYEDAIELYQQWQNPPVHMLTHLAACYAQLGQMDNARRAVKEFERKRPANSDFDFYANAHARLCKRPEDANHWLEGYRKAGLIGRDL